MLNRLMQRNALKQKKKLIRLLLRLSLRKKLKRLLLRQRLLRLRQKKLRSKRLLLLKLLLQKVLNNIYSIYRKTLRKRSVFFVSCLANLEDCQYSRIE